MNILADKIRYLYCFVLFCSFVQKLSRELSCAMLD